MVGTILSVSKKNKLIHHLCLFLRIYSNFTNIIVMKKPILRILQFGIVCIMTIALHVVFLLS